MNLKLDTNAAVTYNIDAIFETAILYGDYSALSGADVNALNDFQDDIDVSGHGGVWEFGAHEHDSFERCDISGLDADVMTSATYTPYIPG